MPKTRSAIVFSHILRQAYAEATKLSSLTS
jgi:hypothetical protein